MNNIIYYFTGTGNSLYVAKQLSKNIENVELRPIASAIKKDNIDINCNKFGIIFPLYYGGVPEIVERFLQEASIKADYIFAIATRGVTSGKAMKQINNILKTKNLSLDYNAYITMPANYIRMYNMKSNKKNENILKNSSDKITNIADDINKGIHKNIRKNIVCDTLSLITYNPWRKKVNTMDNNIYADEKCTSCGLCLKLCPVANISMMDNKPMWNHKCQDCMACVQNCPKKAIQVGKRTIKRERYRNPYVSLEEIINQK